MSQDTSATPPGEKRRSILDGRDNVKKRRSIFFAFAFALTAAALPAAGAPDLHSPATGMVTFRGTEYFLRSTQGNVSDFTPRGQEDLSAFTDMLELNQYPAAHDHEALSRISGRIQAIAQGAKGTILQTISASASGQQPGEHFFSATLPTAHGTDFDAIRFVLVEKQGYGVFYTHRSYGESATASTSEWVKKNAADVQKQLLQFDAARTVSAVKNPTSPSAPASNTDLPAGTIKKGTLTSPLLMHDTMLGVAGQMGALGCSKVEDVTPYVVTPFAGAAGRRQWQEKWLVKGCGKEYPIDIDFKEDGAGGADWTIKK